MTDKRPARSLEDAAFDAARGRSRMINAKEDDMSDEKEPEKLSKEELDQVQGGYSVWIGGSVKAGDQPQSGITLDNGIKRKGVWAPDRDGGSVIADNAGIDGVKK